MRRAGVNLVTLGVFAWSSLQPEPGRWEFGWLDRVFDLLHAQRRPGRPGHPDRVPAAVVRPETSGHADGHRRRHAAQPRQPRHLLRERTGVQNRFEGTGGGAGRPLRRPPGAGDVARPQRIRHLVPLRPRGPRLPRLAARPPRRPGHPERPVDHRVLVAGLRGLGRDPAPQSHPVAAEPIAGARLPPVPLRRDARPLHRTARHPAPDGQTDHHQLRLRLLGPRRPLEMGPRGRPGGHRRLPDRRPRRGVGLRRRPGPVMGGWQAVDPDGTGGRGRVHP